MRGRLAGLILAGILTACGDMPQPFRHEGNNEALRPQAARAVVVVPPDGPEGAALAKAMVRRLLDAEIPASTRPVGGDAAWTLAGRCESNGTNVLVRWRLSRAEAPPFEVTRTLPATAWTAASPALMEGLAGDLVLAVLPALAEAPPLVSSPPAVSRTLRLAPLTGLPGDGNRALAEAMRRQLKGTGLVLVEGDGPADLEARLQVALVPQPGGDALTLVWRVVTPAGKELGQATQRGAVPHGRLDQAWGALADDIAAGSTEGLLAILRGGKR